MAFVPSHRHDIFVSYAHVDDLPFPGIEKGWVTALVETLEILLAQKLGRREAYSLWMDRGLSRHRELTPEILSHLGDTATLLVILSPGYVASEWCLREKDKFFEKMEQRYPKGSRVFLVERDAIGFENRPDAFRDLLGYRFWVQDGADQPPRVLGSPWPDPKNPENMAYFDELTRLSHDLVDQLRTLREADSGSSGGGSPGAEPSGGTDTGSPGVGPGSVSAADEEPAVFLAEVTDDLDGHRDAVRRYLEQAGLRVLPDTWYPRDAEGFAREAQEDLERCRLFVQLLGPLAGKRPPGHDETTYARLQYECAAAADLPIVQWRSRDLDPAAVEDAEHRAFLDHETVMAVGLEELKRTIVEQARASAAEDEDESADEALAVPGDALVFIDADAVDIALAAQLAEVLEEQGIAAVLPLHAGSPSEVRQDFEQNLLICDGLMIVHGESEARWVRDQMLAVRKLAWKREMPLRALALVNGPPTPKDPVRFSLPRMVTVETAGEADAASLAPFLQSLAEKTS